MKVAPVPVQERKRLKALSEYQIFDTKPDADYDFITSMAAKVCEKPIALLSFIDGNRQWIKSSFGTDIKELVLSKTICSQSVDAPDDIFIVEDLSKDKRYSNNEYFYGDQKAQFYAGKALVNADGFVLGTLSVIDTKPGSLSDEQQKMLVSLTHQVQNILELRKKTWQLDDAQANLRMALSDLQAITFIASHDLKSPVNNIISLVHIIGEEYSEVIGTDGNEYVNFISEAAYYLSDMVSSIHSYSKTSGMPVGEYEWVNSAELIDGIKSIINLPESCIFSTEISCDEIRIPKEALKQILFHLLVNAIQYNNKAQPAILVKVDEDTYNYNFEVRDNGEGIAESDYEKIFELFKRLKNRDKNGENMGIGLAIVRRLVEKAHGKIKVESTIDIGSSFCFNIPKQSILS